MNGISRYTKLKAIVSMFLDTVDKSVASFDKAWIMAFRGYQLCGFQCTWEPKTVRLPVLPNMTVPLPADYIMWSKIGVLNNSNEISCFKINNNLTTFRDNNPQRLEDLTPDVNNSFNYLFGFPYFLNYYGGAGYYYSVPYFGLGNGEITFGECRVDEQNGVIILPTTYAFPDIMLEYISSPQQDDDYAVESCMTEAIIAFIEWKMKLNTEANFYARLLESRRSLPNKRVSLQELNNAIRDSNGFKLKL